MRRFTLSFLKIPGSLCRVFPITLLFLIGAAFLTSSRVHSPAQAAAPTPSVTSAVIARGFQNGKAIGASRRFPDSVAAWYCVVRLNRAERVQARFDWIAVDAAATRDHALLSRRNIGPLKDNVLYSWVKISKGRWPKGKYQVKIFLNGKFARAVDYVVF